MKLFFVSEVACPVFEKARLERYLSSLKLYAGGVLIFFGLLFGLLAPIFVPALVFVISTFATFMILSGFAYWLYMDIVPNKLVLYVSAGSILIFSLASSFFLARVRICCKPPPETDEVQPVTLPIKLKEKCRNIYWGVVFTAGCTGLLFGHLLIISFLVSQPNIFWLMIHWPAVLFALLALRFEWPIVIFVSAFVGSYCIVRGISFYVEISLGMDAFPNEVAFH